MSAPLGSVRAGWCLSSGRKNVKWWECQDAGGPLTQAGRKVKKCSRWRRRGEVGLWLRLERRQWDASRSVATEARRQKRKHWSIARMWHAAPNPFQAGGLRVLVAVFSPPDYSSAMEIKEEGSCQNLALGNCETHASVEASSMILCCLSLSAGKKQNFCYALSSIPSCDCVTLKRRLLIKQELEASNFPA